MTTDESPSVQSEAMGSRVEGVERQVVALTAAHSAVRRRRWLLPLGFLVFVCVFCFLFYRLKDSFLEQDNLNEMKRLAQQRLEGSLLETLKRQGQTLVETSRPVLEAAFKERAEADTPKYTAELEKQRKLLLENLQERLKQQVNDHYQEVLKRHRAIIKEEYPDLSDEQLGQMALNLEKATRHLVEKYYVEHMRRELQDMFDTWERFPKAEAPKPGDPPLEDVLIGCLLEILTDELSGSQLGVVEADAT